MSEIKRELVSVELTIIGDEILSGRRVDKHLVHAIAYFQERIVDIRRVTYLGDDKRDLVDHFRTLAGRDIVNFSFGGIGATPDDITRQSVAAAHDVNMIRHPQAVKLIEERFGETAYPNRILMAELPEGCSLIPNDYNKIPGFSLGHIHCLPGFPEMAWQMMDWVVRNHYRLPENQDVHFNSIIVRNVRESELIRPLETLQKQFPDVKISSLPRFPGAGTWQTELGVRGSRGETEQVMELLKERLLEQGYDIAIDVSS